MNTTNTFTLFPHEAGCPVLTAAGNPACTCGMEAEFKAWVGFRSDVAPHSPREAMLREAFAAGWTAQRLPRVGASTLTAGAALGEGVR